MWCNVCVWVLFLSLSSINELSQQQQDDNASDVNDEENESERALNLWRT